MKGVTLEQREIIEKVFDDYRRDFAFFCYGSRVKGNFEKTSDLDVLIRGKEAIPFSTLEEIKERFEASDLPFIVNFTDYYAIDPEFYRKIETSLVRV